MTDMRDTFFIFIPLVFTFRLIYNDDSAQTASQNTIKPERTTRQKSEGLIESSGIIERMVDPMPNDEEKMNRLRRAMYSRSLSPKLHERQRRTLAGDRIDVAEDWKREEPKLESIMVAPRMSGIWRGAARWLGVALVAFLVGAAGVRS